MDCRSSYSALGRFANFRARGNQWPSVSARGFRSGARRSRAHGTSGGAYRRWRCSAEQLNGRGRAMVCVRSRLLRGNQLAVAITYRIATGGWPAFNQTPWFVMLAAICSRHQYKRAKNSAGAGMRCQVSPHTSELPVASLIVGVVWAGCIYRSSSFQALTNRASLFGVITGRNRASAGNGVALLANEWKPAADDAHARRC